MFNTLRKVWYRTALCGCYSFLHYHCSLLNCIVPLIAHLTKDTESYECSLHLPHHIALKYLLLQAFTKIYKCICIAIHVVLNYFYKHSFYQSLLRVIINLLYYVYAYIHICANIHAYILTYIIFYTIDRKPAVSL